MFYWIYTNFGNQLEVLRIFSYVSFRGLMAGLTAMVLTFYFGKKIINFLHDLKFKETIRSDGPKSHEKKMGTPTMGGLIIVTTMLISILFWGNLYNKNLILLLVFGILFGTLGFADDYMKAILKIKNGMRAKTKFLLSILLAFLFCTIYFYYTGQSSFETGIEKSFIHRKIHFSMTDLFVPFLKNPLLTLGFLSIPFGMLVILGASHGVNLTDGLDGLAAGCAVIATLTFSIIAYISGTPLVANYLNLPYLYESHEYVIYLSALSGSLIGFLWYNSNPAEVFMGDTGSLFLGSSLGMISIMLKKELLLVLLGGIFVAESLSVILQVVSFKLRGKRIFKMAPLHHHFELSGFSETKIVLRFWIIAIILAILSLSTIKIQ